MKTSQSLPSWERGLKFRLPAFLTHRIRVAPLVGARIEIGHYGTGIIVHRVAPLVGARIEIRRSSTTYELGEVAPLVGARIEIGCCYG